MDLLRLAFLVAFISLFVLLALAPGRAWASHFRSRPGFKIVNSVLGPAVRYSRGGMHIVVQRVATKYSSWFDVTVKPSPLGKTTTLRLAMENAGTRLLRRLGLQDLQVGIKEIDDKYRIAGSDPALLKRLLTDRDVERAMSFVFGSGSRWARIRCKPRVMKVRVDGWFTEPEDAERCAINTWRLAAVMRSAAGMAPPVDSPSSDAAEGTGAVAALRVQRPRPPAPSPLSLRYTWVFLPVLAATLGYGALANTMSILQCRRDATPTRAVGWCDLTRGSQAFSYNEVFTIASIKGAAVEDGSSAAGNSGREGRGRRIYIHAGNEHHRFIDNDEWSEERRQAEVARINAFIHDPSAQELEVSFDRRLRLIAMMLALSLLAGGLLTFRNWRDDNG